MFKIGSGWNDPHALGLIIIVEFILLFDFLVRTGYDQFRCTQRIFLGVDTARHVVALLNIIALHAVRKKASAFYPAQRMTGVHQRYAQHVCNACSDITGIGIMRMHNVRRAAQIAQIIQGPVRETVQKVPKLLLGDIFLRAGIQAHDVDLAGNLFIGTGVFSA